MKRKLLFAGFATVDYIDNKKYIGGAAGASSINASLMGYHSSLLTVLARNTPGKWYFRTLKKAGVNTDLCIFSAPAIPSCIISHDRNNTEKRVWNDNGSLPYFAKLKLYPQTINQYDRIFLLNAPFNLAVKISGLVNSRKIIYVPGPQLVSGKNKISESCLNKTLILTANQTEKKYIFKSNPFAKGIKIVIITDGKRGGKVYFDNKKYLRYLPGIIKKISDTTGAGDAFTLGFSLYLLDKKPEDLLSSEMIANAVNQGKKLSAKIIKKKGGIII